MPSLVVIWEIGRQGLNGTLEEVRAGIGIGSRPAGGLAPGLILISAISLLLSRVRVVLKSILRPSLGIPPPWSIDGVLAAACRPVSISLSRYAGSTSGWSPFLSVKLNLGISLEVSVVVLKRFIESKVGIRSAGCVLEDARDGVDGILSFRRQKDCWKKCYEQVATLCA